MLFSAFGSMTETIGYVTFQDVAKSNALTQCRVPTGQTTQTVYPISIHICLPTHHEKNAKPMLTREGKSTEYAS